MDIFSENCDINILEDGRTISDFIDNKIKDLASNVSIGDVVTLKCSSQLIYNSVTVLRDS